MKTKNIIMISSVVCVVLVGIFVAYYISKNRSDKSSPTESGGSSTLTPTATDNQSPVEEKKDTTVADKSYVFTPYAGAGLMLTGKVYASLAEQKQIEARITKTKGEIAAFDAKTPIDVKVDKFFMLAADQQLLGKYGESKQTLEQALSLGRNQNILQAYASLLTTMGAKSGAMTYIDQAIAIDPKISNFWQTKIDIMIGLGSSTDAIKAVYQSALIATTNDIDLLTRYARYLGDRGEKDAAIVYWQKASIANPSGAATYKTEIDALRK